jgi:hypothetical protein
MLASPRRTRGAPSTILLDNHGAVSIAVGARVDVLIVDVITEEYCEQPSNGTNPDGSADILIVSETTLEAAPPGPTTESLTSGASVGFGTAEFATALVNTYYSLVTPLVVATRAKISLVVRSSGEAFADVAFVEPSLMDISPTNRSNEAANEVDVIAAPSTTASISTEPIGFSTVVDSPAYLLAAAELATLQPEPIPSSKLSPREPTWASATVTRLRTEMDFRSGLEIVTGYDILFEEQATVTLGSFEGGQWAYGEINVCPHRLRSPSTLPTAADRAIAAVGSSGGAAVRTRVTRGSAAAGSALPGTTVKKEGISASKNTGRYSSTPLQMRLSFTPLP